jgi:hypothetical protein
MSASGLIIPDLSVDRGCTRADAPQISFRDRVMHTPKPKFMWDTNATSEPDCPTPV